MGWLWSSSSTNEAPTTSQAEQSIQESTLPERPMQENHSPETPKTTSLPTPSRPKTRDEIADSELIAYLKSLSSPSHPTPEEDDDIDLLDDDLEDSPSDSTNPHSTSSHPPSSALMTPSHLYPSSASCRQFFDLAFKCQSPGGQVLNVYRYGRFRWCGQHWNNYWWCVRTNRNFGLGQEEREERVRRRYWEQDQRVRRQMEGCSEDVWRQRRVRVREGVFVDGTVPGWPGGEGEGDGEGGGGERVRTH